MMWILLGSVLIVIGAILICVGSILSAACTAMQIRLDEGSSRLQEAIERASPEGRASILQHMKCLHIRWTLNTFKSVVMIVGGLSLIAYGIRIFVEK